nr:uncharacterized protein LOC124223223 isoform X1 [Neodiprion pinetum]
MIEASCCLPLRLNRRFSIHRLTLSPQMAKKKKKKKKKKRRRRRNTKLQKKPMDMTIHRRSFDAGSAINWFHIDHRDIRRLDFEVYLSSSHHS